MRRLAFLLLAGIGLNLTAHAGDWGPWQEAKNFYDSGKFQDALQSLRSSPNGDASYFYNLGNIHYRLGQVGIAVANLEKANRIRPHDPDIQHNLKIARSTLASVIGADRVDQSSTWLETMADNAPLDEIRSTLGLIAFILVVFWIWSYARVRSLKKTFLRPAGILILSAFVLTTGLYVAQRVSSSRPPAICMEPQAVRSGPGEHYLELARVETGEKIRVLGTSTQNGPDIWWQIRYSRDGIGWIRASTLLPL